MTHSTLHAHHDVLGWAWAIFVIRAPLKKQQHYCCVMAVSSGSAMRGENIMCLLLWLLHQPGENKCVCSFYSSSSLLPASWLTPCLPWVQQSVHTVKYSKTAASPFSRVSSQPRDQTHVSNISWIGRKVLYQESHLVFLSHSWGLHLYDLMTS